MQKNNTQNLYSALASTGNYTNEGKVNFRTGEIVYDLGTTHSEKKNGVPNVKTTTLREVFRENYIKRNPNTSADEVNAYLSEYFAEGETIFKDYTTHTMRVFYMERGAGASNLYMRFNIASVTPGHVVVSKTVEGDGADELPLANMYRYYVVSPNGKLCRYDSASRSFADTGLEYSHSIISALDNPEHEPVEGVYYDDVTFSTSGSDVLTVTNTLDGTVPSGLSSNIRTALALIALPLLPVGCILYCKRRRRKAAV